MNDDTFAPPPPRSKEETRFFQELACGFFAIAATVCAIIAAVQWIVQLIAK